MRVQLVRKKANLIVRLKGELDHHSSNLLREAVEKELKKDIVQNIILNMEKITFMDSSGLGVILGRYKQVKARGGQVIICVRNEHVKRILQMGGLLKVVPLYNDEKTALSSIK